MKKRQVMLYVGVVLTLCALAICAGCQTTSGNGGSTTSDLMNDPAALGEDGVYTITGVADYATYTNLQEMIQAPDYIVMGYFDWDRSESWNMNRDLEDPSKESDLFYVEGVLYDFHVLDVLKGEIDAEQITVNFPYSHEIKGELTNQVVNERGEIVKEATERDPYSFMVQYEYYVNPFLYNMDRVSLLFLYYNEDFDLYFPSGVPYMATVDSEGKVRLRSDLIVPTEAQREEMERKRAEYATSDASEDYRHWTDREDAIYYSEGGQKIRYIRSGDFVENFLPDTYIEDVLDALELSPAEKDAALEALDKVELPPHPAAEQVKKAFELQRWD